MSDRGENLYGMFRTGTRCYKSRPPANCRAARAAWDIHRKNGEIVWMQLLDGYWGAQRPQKPDGSEGDIDEITNSGHLTT